MMKNEILTMTPPIVFLSAFRESTKKVVLFLNGTAIIKKRNKKITKQTCYHIYMPVF